MVESKKKWDTVGGRECEYCHFCGHLIQSNLYQSGYGGGSYDRQTHKPFSDRTFKFPEGYLSLKICSECEDKPSSELIHKARLKAVEDEIDRAKRYIESRNRSISHLESEIAKLDELKDMLEHYLENLKKNNPVIDWDKIKIPHDMR